MFHLRNRSRLDQPAEFRAAFGREFVQVQAQFFGQVETGLAQARAQRTQAEIVEERLGRRGLGVADAVVFADRKAVVEAWAQVTVPKRAERVEDAARVLRGDGGQGVGYVGQQVVPLEDELQRDVGLRQQDGAQRGGKGGIGAVQFVEAPCHVDAPFQRQDVPGPGPAMQQQARLRRAFDARDLPKACDGEVGQGFKWVQEVCFHIG